MSIQNGYTILGHGKLKIILRRLSFKKGINYYRQGSYSEEIIWDGRKFLFPSPKKKMQDGMWVFRSVLNDVKDYIFDKRIKSKERLPVNFWNPDKGNVRCKVTATDVDHAYWRIAYLNGIISKKTYEKGLLIKDKSLRLASLANLSSAKEYQIIKDGIITEKTVVMKYDPILQKVYNNIRYTCYEHMIVMADLLGDDFICYKTDCIYYRDTKENKKIVQDYLDSVNLEWKQLVEVEKPKKEDLNTFTKYKYEEL
jgi:hypothetical protein